MCRWQRMERVACCPCAVIAIELLAGAQGCDFHTPLTSSDGLEAVRRLIRTQIDRLAEDRYFHPDITRAIQLVRSAAVIAAANSSALPGL